MKKLWTPTASGLENQQESFVSQKKKSNSPLSVLFEIIRKLDDYFSVYRYNDYVLWTEQI